MRPLSHFQPILQLDFRWPLTLDIWPLTCMNIWRFPYCIYYPTLVEIHQSMWKIEPNVNLFSQQTTTWTANNCRGQSDPYVSFLLRQATQKHWRAKSKIGHQCDGWNFFFQLSFLSSQKSRHFMYITWINNHCTPQKHQWGAAMIKHVTVASHLQVRRTEFCFKIPSVAKIHFRLSCLSSCVILHREYTTQ